MEVKKAFQDLTSSKEKHEVDLKRLNSSHQDKVVRLEAEIDELFTELDR